MKTITDQEGKMQLICDCGKVMYRRRVNTSQGYRIGWFCSKCVKALFEDTIRIKPVKYPKTAMPGRKLSCIEDEEEEYSLKVRTKDRTEEGE